jgi:hypothetical protein
MTSTIGTGSGYSVTIPEYSDNADIQAAIKLLMFGTTASVTQESQIQEASIAGYIKALDSRVDNLASSEVVQLTTNQNLNDRVSTGKFLQASNTNAETGTNYPIFLTKRWAGALTVSAYDQNVFQLYEGAAGTSGAVVSQGFLAWRSKPNGGSWSDWVIASDTSHTHDDRYFTESEINEKFTALTKSSVGLSNVDNTSDANKPISTLTQAALDLKATTSELSNYVASTTTDRIFVQASAPTGAVNGDLWFW